MRLYLDQMIKVDLAEILRGHGHEVLRASDVGQSRAEDDAILAFCISDNRILITLDDDFGNWAILPLEKHSGVIRIKSHPPKTENIAEILLPLLKDRNHGDFINRLVIVSPNGIRWIRTATEV